MAPMQSTAGGFGMSSAASIGGMKLRIQMQPAEVKSLLLMMGITAPAAIRKVLTRAVNKTLTSTRAEATRAIRRESPNLKARDVRGAMRIRRTSSRLLARNIGGSVTVGSRRISLMSMGARQTKKGVTYRGDSGGRELIPSAFVATMDSGHEGVFKRRGGGRLPITELRGPSAAYVLDSHAATLQAVLNEAGKTLRKYTIAQARLELERAARRAGRTA